MTETHREYGRTTEGGMYEVGIHEASRQGHTQYANTSLHTDIPGERYRRIYYENTARRRVLTANLMELLE